MAGQAIPWNPTSIKDAEKKAKNNIYVKNIPDNWTEATLKETFGKYGNVSSAVLMNHANGKFAFVCFQDPNGKDHNYGPNVAMKAVEELNGMKIEDKELFVTFAQSQVQRKIQVQKQIINLKTSKKRCNLLVRGFAENWGEQDIRNVFEQFGKIENIKLL